jgi:hypothetical protein
VTAVLIVGVLIGLFLFIEVFGSDDEHLAMTVWAAFGPFRSAADAEEALSRSVRAVFGAENYDKHAGWVQGHADNFRLWENQHIFDKSQRFMRLALWASARGAGFEQACRKVKDEARKLALEAMDRINKDLETTGVRYEAVLGADGALDLWIADDLGQESRAARIANDISHNLLAASSEAAVTMRGFLRSLSRDGQVGDTEETESIGRIWLRCHDSSEQDPESERAKAFKAVNDAWWAEGAWFGGDP